MEIDGNGKYSNTEGQTATQWFLRVKNQTVEGLHYVAAPTSSSKALNTTYSFLKLDSWLSKDLIF